MTFSPLPFLRQVILEARETLVHFLFPGGPVCGGCIPGVGVDAQRFEVALASGWSLPFHQLTVEKVLADASVVVLNSTEISYQHSLSKEACNTVSRLPKKNYK